MQLAAAAVDPRGSQAGGEKRRGVGVSQALFTPADPLWWRWADLSKYRKYTNVGIDIDRSQCNEIDTLVSVSLLYALLRFCFCVSAAATSITLIITSGGSKS